MSTTLGEGGFSLAAAACGTTPCAQLATLLCLVWLPPAARRRRWTELAPPRRSLPQARELWQHLLLQLGAADALLLPTLQVGGELWA